MRFMHFQPGPGQMQITALPVGIQSICLIKKGSKALWQSWALAIYFI